jgi:hypothetical protein
MEQNNSDDLAKKRIAAKNYLCRLLEAGPDRHIELFFALVVAFATVGGAFATYAQYRIYEWQKQSDISVHRPLVSPTRIDLDISADPLCKTDEVCKVQQDFQNIGAGPTNNLEIRVGFKESPRAKSFHPQESDLKQDILWTLVPAGAAIYPHGPYTPVSTPIGREEISRLINQHLSLYVFSKVTYQDLFPDHPNWHIMEYCARMDNFHYIPDGDVVPKTGIQWDTDWSCNRENRDYECTDQECGKDFQDLLKTEAR